METKTRVLIAEPGEDLRHLLAAHIEEDEGMELAGGGRRRGSAGARLASAPGRAADGADASEAGRAQPAAPCGGGQPRHPMRSGLRLLERAGHRGVLGAWGLLLHPETLRRGLGALEYPAAHRREAAPGGAHARRRAVQRAQP